MSAKSGVGSPEVTRTYQNHHLDSTRWRVYEPRRDDIVVSTSYKSGTTWAQEILRWLLHGDDDPVPEVDRKLTPWVDARFSSDDLADLRSTLDGLGPRRFLKSHLPLDALPYFPEVRYVVVGRDPRDVFMSLFNHYSAYTDAAYELVNGSDRVGPPFPRCPATPQELWPDWIGRGWFDWESEGWPMWANMGHTQSYWRYRHLPNLLFLHYNEMLADLDGAVRRLAEFCRIVVDDRIIARAVERSTFANVRKEIEATPEEEDDDGFFEGGRRRFFFRGTNGRWRGVLTDEDLARYEVAKDRVLDPDCSAWLEEGGVVGAEASNPS